MAASKSERMTELAETFPSLRGAPGVRPWKALALNQWASRKRTSVQAKFAVRFLLSIWDRNVKWKIGPFHIALARSCWDEEHRAAFVAWVTNPWRP